MYLTDEMELAEFRVNTRGVTITYDGSEMAVCLQDGSALSAAQARALLDALAFRVRDEQGPFADTGLAVAASLAASAKVTIDPKMTFPAIECTDPRPRHIGGGDWRPSVAVERADAAPAPDTSVGVPSDTVVVAADPEPPQAPTPAPDPGPGGVPEVLLEAKRVKEVVAYYLDQGLDPDGVWAACEPLVQSIPALKRLRDAEERVKRVATAFHEE